MLHLVLHCFQKGNKASLRGRHCALHKLPLPVVHVADQLHQTVPHVLRGFDVYGNVVLQSLLLLLRATLEILELRERVCFEQFQALIKCPHFSEDDHEKLWNRHVGGVWLRILQMLTHHLEPLSFEVHPLHELGGRHNVPRRACPAKTAVVRLFILGLLLLALAVLHPQRRRRAVFHGESFCRTTHGARRRCSFLLDIASTLCGSLHVSHPLVLVRFDVGRKCERRLVCKFNGDHVLSLPRTEARRCGTPHSPCVRAATRPYTSITFNCSHHRLAGRPPHAHLGRLLQVKNHRRPCTFRVAALRVDDQVSANNTDPRVLAVVSRVVIRMPIFFVLLVLLQLLFPERGGPLHK